MDSSLNEELEKLKKRIEELERRPVYVPVYPVWPQISPSTPVVPGWPVPDGPGTVPNWPPGLQSTWFCSMATNAARAG